MAKKKRKYTRRKPVEPEKESIEEDAKGVVAPLGLRPLEDKEEESFADKIQTIAMKTEPRTYIERPVRLQVKGRPVIRMRKQHMTKG